jgi:hypothetical protein
VAFGKCDKARLTKQDLWAGGDGAEQVVGRAVEDIRVLGLGFRVYYVIILEQC